MKNARPRLYAEEGGDCMKQCTGAKDISDLSLDDGLMANPVEVGVFMGQARPETT